MAKGCLRAVNFGIARREFWHQPKVKADAHKSKHSVHFISTATHSAEHWLAAATRLGPASEWSGGAMPRPGGSGRAPVRRGNPSRGCCFEVFLPLQPATPEPVSWGPHLLLTQAAKPAMIQTYWNLHPPLRLCSDKVWRSSYIQSSSPGIVSSVIWPHRWFGHSNQADSNQFDFFLCSGLPAFLCSRILLLTEAFHLNVWSQRTFVIPWDHVLVVRLDCL